MAQQSSRPNAAVLAGAGAAVLGLGSFLYLRAKRPPVINRAVPEPAKPVDLNRYLGRWYEIARHEYLFEEGMDAVTADYSRLAADKIGVTNAGTRGGKRKVARAKGAVADKETGAKLKLSFFGPLYVGDYWVLDHADDYSWSIVGEPGGRYLWLLSRSPRPGDKEVDALFARAKSLGYDTSALRRTHQP
jgi:apolipoprotein D and lipocalin family protein